MSEFNDIVKLAVDAYKGAPIKYSVGESMDVLREALIQANNGSTTLDYRAIRDGKCNGLFTLIETILSKTVVEGLQGDEYFNNFVEFRNVALGDKNVFEVEDDILFTVSDAADGTQAIRRQRLGGMTQTSIPTSFHVVKIYDELNRVLSGQVDLNKMINAVGTAFRRKMLDDVYSLWAGATANDFGGTTYFPVAGAYSEDALLDLIGHVEAASGKSATIVGTKKALRNLVPSIVADGYKDDLYAMGYAGKFYGTPVAVTPQRHKVGSTEFLLDDDVIHVIAGDSKPIKVVYEGQSTVIMGNPMDKQDLTQEYLYGEKYGMGIITAGNFAGIGRYEMT